MDIQSRPDKTFRKYAEFRAKWLKISFYLGTPLFIFVWIPLIIIFSLHTSKNYPVIGYIIIPCFFIVVPTIAYLRWTRWFLGHDWSQGQTMDQPAATPVTAGSTSFAQEEILLQLPNIMFVRVSYIGMKRFLPHPENVLVVTNQALYFLYVPVPGGDNTVINLQWLHYMFNGKGITRRLKSLLAQRGLNQIYQMDIRNWRVPLTNVAQASLSTKQHVLEIQANQKDNRKYVVKDASLLDQLAQILQARGITVQR